MIHLELTIEELKLLILGLELLDADFGLSESEEEFLNELKKNLEKTDKLKK